MQEIFSYILHTETLVPLVLILMIFGIGSYVHLVWTLTNKYYKKIDIDKQNRKDETEYATKKELISEVEKIAIASDGHLNTIDAKLEHLETMIGQGLENIRVLISTNQSK